MLQCLPFFSGYYLEVAKNPSFFLIFSEKFSLFLKNAVERCFHHLFFLQKYIMDENSTIANTSSMSINQEEELPADMRFNSGHVVSIVGYSTLFLVSSVANCTVLMILIRRYRKTKSRVNLLLIHLAIADLIGKRCKFLILQFQVMD